jgi:hypothetical protein
MAQKQKAPKQPQDPYAQQSKALTSSVQRLRGWVGSDPSRAPELADALVQLTAHRLLGHGYAAAGADAQDAVRRAAELLAAKGPIGPYTSITDAARYVTAVVHMAAIQAGLGRSDAAEQTIESLHDMRQQLHGLGLEERLEPQTAIWALSCSAQAALVSADIATANAYADAALARLGESGLADDQDAQFLAIDVEWFASDARWAAGRTEEAIIFLHAAKDRYDEVVAGRLDHPGRLGPALLERLAEPLFGLYRDLADRLIATGKVDLGLVIRRTLIERLRALTNRLDSTPAQLAAALADLGRNLAESGRVDEAAAASAESAAIESSAERSGAAVHDHIAKGLSLGTQSVIWSPLPPTDSYAATTAAGAAQVDLAAAFAERRRKTAAWLQAESAEAHRAEQERMEQARLEDQQREAEQAAAERAAAEQRATELAEAADAERVEAERRGRAEAAERLERKRRREERIEEHRLEVERREAEQREAERLEAERQELERLQAQIDELERAEKRREEQ